MKQLIPGVSNDFLIIGGLALAAGGAYLYRKSQSNISIDQDGGGQAPANTPAAPTGSGNNSGSGTPTVTLNKTLKLKKGSVGNEVRELQKLLGVNQDGDFGKKTEDALLAKKGVLSCTLKEYDSLQDVNTNPLAVGSRIMANKKFDLPWSFVDGIQVFEANKRADGFYDLVESSVSNVAYGTEVGTIRSLNTAKTKYLISRPGQTAIYGWVWAAHVKKI